MTLANSLPLDVAQPFQAVCSLVKIKTPNSGT